MINVFSMVQIQQQSNEMLITTFHSLMKKIKLADFLNQSTEIDYFIWLSDECIMMSNNTDEAFIRLLNEKGRPPISFFDSVYLNQYVFYTATNQVIQSLITDYDNRTNSQPN